MADMYAYDHGLPCQNPHCKSHGQPHPNCKCYSGGGEGYAQGGSVCAERAPHLPNCAYYAEGGSVQAHPRTTKGHSGAHHGLLGLLKDVGHAKLSEPEKHTKLLDEARSHYSSLQDPLDSEIPIKKTQGVKMANLVATGSNDDLAEMLHGHPMVGGVGKENLKGMLPVLSHSLMANEPDPEAFKSSVDYLHSAVKGHDKLKNMSSSFLGAKGQRLLEPDEKSREALKEHLQKVTEDPSELLKVGGKLGHYLPEQATQLAAAAATATNYLSSIKPLPHQPGPLDKVIEPGKMEMAQYDRQIDIAQQPLLILQHVKDGTLMPQDITTLKMIFPGLYDSMVSEATEALVNAKQKEMEIPYKQKQSLSMLLGQPLDYTMTPNAMQAIMKAQGPQQQRQQAKAEPKKASGVELKQINKVDEMGETSLEKRLINKK